MFVKHGVQDRKLPSALVWILLAVTSRHMVVAGPGSSRTASVIRYQCKEGRMKTLFLLVLSCKVITVWMTNKELGCRRALDEGWEPITNITWYCDQENGKLTCKNSLNFECNTSIKPFERNVTTDQESVLGLKHAGACNNAVPLCKNHSKIMSPKISIFQLSWISETSNWRSTGGDFTVRSSKDWLNIICWTYWQMLPLILCLYFCCVSH